MRRTLLTLAFGVLAGLVCPPSLTAQLSGLLLQVNGERALWVDTESNTSIGYLALKANTTGYWNTAVGHGALLLNTEGHNNTAVGIRSMEQSLSAFDNTAIGVASLFSLTTGDRNAACGYQALNSLTTGGSNTAVGTDALYSNVTHSFNTAVGRDAFRALANSGGVALGYGAGYYETAGNRLFIDNMRRESEADGRAKALVYGIFNVDPAQQQLHVNGHLATPLDVTIGSTTLVETIDSQTGKHKLCVRFPTGSDVCIATES
jgi:hypothetical protein